VCSRFSYTFLTSSFRYHAPSVREVARILCLASAGYRRRGIRAACLELARVILGGLVRPIQEDRCG